MLYTNLKRLKVRLQFTGWLQYVPTAIFKLIFIFDRQFYTAIWKNMGCATV